MPAEKINAPGAPAQRGPNELGVWEEMPALPRTLSHVVLFVPDIEIATKFYCDRLGFVITDILTGAGPFLRPKANDDHHTLFFIRTPEYMKGCEHLAFHMGGPTELMVAGTRFVKRGYQSFWGLAVTSSARTGSGTSTARSAVISNMTPTWTSTTTPGSHAKRRTAPKPPRSCSSNIAKSGHLAVALRPARRANCGQARRGRRTCLAIWLRPSLGKTASVSAIDDVAEGQARGFGPLEGSKRR